MREYPDVVYGQEVWSSIEQAVPRKFDDAINIWGSEVFGDLKAEEWESKTTEENALWLLCRLHLQKLLEKCKTWRMTDEEVEELLK